MQDDRVCTELTSRVLPRLIIIVVLLIAVCSSRLVPLALSPYPFNNDSLTEATVAQDIVSSGSLEVSDWRVSSATNDLVTPVFNVLLAFTSSFLGTDTFAVGHAVVVVSSLLVVLGIYLVNHLVTRSARGSLMGALFLVYLGTFVYLSGSAWKESLGVALMVFFFYCYMKRSETRMFVLEIALLVMIPFVHHLVAIITYTSLAFLTLWSLWSAYSCAGLRRRHFIDAFVLGTTSMFAFIYYMSGSVSGSVSGSIEKLSYLTNASGLATAIVIFGTLTISAMFVLSIRNHAKFSYAPIVFATLLGAFLLDYSSPVFPYTPGTNSQVIVLAVCTILMVTYSWFGIECILESESKFRVIAVGMMLPVVMAIVLALTMSQELAGHQLIYRSFDFFDIPLSIGVAGATVHVLRGGRRKWFVVAVVLLMVVSFPFGYFSGPLLGIRHDTQDYEVDALGFARELSSNSTTFQSDERLCYIAMAIFDFRKLPTLPSKLSLGLSLNPDVVYAVEDKWTTEGVNDYPRGHPIIDESYLGEVLTTMDVLYIGGPVDDRITLFMFSYPSLGSITSTNDISYGEVSDND